MIAVFKVRESFSHEEIPELEQNCRQFAEEFPAARSEFFYTLQASEPERFFIIRTATGERERFIAAVEGLSRRLQFEVLKKRESEEVLFRNDLRMFE